MKRTVNSFTLGVPNVGRLDFSLDIRINMTSNAISHKYFVSSIYDKNRKANSDNDFTVNMYAFLNTKFLTVRFVCLKELRAVICLICRACTRTLCLQFFYPSVSKYSVLPHAPINLTCKCHFPSLSTNR